VSVRVYLCVFVCVWIMEHYSFSLASLTERDRQTDRHTLLTNLLRYIIYSVGLQGSIAP
jgi:hypothetical protein